MSRMRCGHRSWRWLATNMRFGLAWLAISCSLLAACNDRRASPRNDDPYIIKDDGGGQLISAEADRALLQFWGGKVEIHSTCASACTIFTTLPNACIMPDAKIGFHGSNINVGPIGNYQMSKYLRGAVRDRFEEEWKFIPTDQIHWVPARDYIQMDPQSRLCDR